MPFNLVFKSTAGPSTAAPVYLRPKTAQGKFLNFRKLLDKRTQLTSQTTPQTVSINNAVESRTIDNETPGYFLGRITLFLLKIGVDPSKIRFRQHLDNEMAHYACDCWDAELLNTYGWIGCVGCADRSAYDLTVHSRFTGNPLVV
ncbi:hypothetical protein EV127DRAFT_403744 [Xylaria flabelliformis]|nr:hypothetical protein EV127DRAFT_403744 [Xylaria flabelliformis]